MVNLPTKLAYFIVTGGYGEEEMMCFRVSFERKILERSVKFFSVLNLRVL